MSNPTELELIERLGGHTPQEVLIDRSLYNPSEPTNPDLAEFFWGELERGSESGLSHSIEQSLYYRSYASDERYRRFGKIDQTVLAETLTLDCLEWFLHNIYPISFYNRRSRRDFNPIAGMVSGVVNYQKPSPSSRDEINLRVSRAKQVFVIPEEYDGEINGLAAQLQSGTSLVVIGNVGDVFAQSIEQGASVELYGSTGDETASQASRSIKSKSRARVVVHGDVGDRVAEAARSLWLHVDGNCGDLLGTRAGFEPYGIYEKEGPQTSVLIRVNGSVGDRLADDARGKIDISVGKAIKGFGNVSRTQGKIELSDFPPGSPEYKGAKNKQKPLYADGQLIMSESPQSGNGIVRPNWMNK